MNKGYSIMKLLPALSILFILVGFIALTVAIYRSGKRLEDLKRERELVQNEINIKNHKLTSLKNIIQQLDDSIAMRKANRVISLNSENSFIDQRIDEEELSAENIIFSNRIDSASENKFRSALNFEAQGFEYLLQKDVDQAIDAFRQSELSYPQFHMVYEIASFLTENRESLKSKDEASWNSAYRKILKDYSWKMPKEYKSRLKQLINNS